MRVRSLLSDRPVGDGGRRSGSLRLDRRVLEREAFAFPPNKFFTPPVLQQQSTFLDIFSDVDLQMLLVAHMYNTNTEDCFLRAVAGLMVATGRRRS